MMTPMSNNKDLYLLKSSFLSEAVGVPAERDRVSSGLYFITYRVHYPIVEIGRCVNTTGFLSYFFIVLGYLTVGIRRVE